MNPLLQLKKLALPLVLFSLITNLAVLVSPIYMMQVLDRVVPSGNLSTLALLLVVALLVVAAHGFVEYCRDTCLMRTNRWVESVGASAALKASGQERQSAIHNVGQLGKFFSQGLATTALNVPWIPLFLFALFLIHPFFVFLIAGIIGSIYAIKKICDFLSGDLNARAQGISQDEMTTLEDATDPHLVSGIRAIFENLTLRFFQLQKQRHSLEERATSASNVKTASLGFLRTTAQLLSLSLGAFLVVKSELTAGGMIGRQ